MTALSSIHFKQSISNNIYHNDRSKAPSYLLKDGGLGIEVNRSAIDAQKLYTKLLEESTKNYYERTHQRIQTKCNRWSAVVNIKDTTTMQDLEKLAEHFKNKYKWECIQIAIHRDEGHVDKDTNAVKINHHAHLEFYTLDKDGINRFKKNEFGKKRMSEIQTEVAEILGMTRGQKFSKKTRLEHKQYKAHIQEIESKELQIKKHQKEIKNLSQELEKEKQEKSKTKFLTKKAVKERLEIERKTMKDKGFKAEDFRALNALNKSSFETQEDLEDAIKNLHEEISKKRELEQLAEVKQNQVKNLKDAYKSEVDNLKKENEILRNDIQLIQEQKEQQKEQEKNQKKEQLEQVKKIKELQEQLEQRDKEFLLTKIRINELEKINNKKTVALETLTQENTQIKNELTDTKKELSKFKKLYEEITQAFNTLKERFIDKVKEAVNEYLKNEDKAKDVKLNLIVVSEPTKISNFTHFIAIDKSTMKEYILKVTEDKKISLGSPIIVNGTLKQNKIIAKSIEINKDLSKQIKEQMNNKKHTNRGMDR